MLKKLKDILKNLNPTLVNKSFNYADDRWQDGVEFYISAKDIESYALPKDTDIETYKHGEELKIKLSSILNKPETATDADIDFLVAMYKATVMFEVYKRQSDAFMEAISLFRISLKQEHSSVYNLMEADRKIKKTLADADSKSKTPKVVINISETGASKAIYKAKVSLEEQLNAIKNMLGLDVRVFDYTMYAYSQMFPNKSIETFGRELNSLIYKDALTSPSNDSSLFNAIRQDGETIDKTINRLEVKIEKSYRGVRKARKSPISWKR